MAEYIPAGRDYIPTTTEYIGTLTMTRKGTDKDLKRLLRSFAESKPAIFGNDKIYISFLKTEWIAKNIMQALFEFQVNGQPTEQLWDTLKTYGLLERRIKQNYETLDHNGYVKHDVEKRHEVSETITVRLQDILPDKEGNEWEVFVMEADGYYCDLCQDTHDECIEKHLFKTPAEAEAKYAELIKDYHG